MLYGGLCGARCTSTVRYSCGGWLSGDGFSGLGDLSLFGVTLGRGRFFHSFSPCWLVGGLAGGGYVCFGAHPGVAICFLLAPVEDYASNFLMFANIATIAYGPKITQNLKILVVCNISHI